MTTAIASALLGITAKARARARRNVAGFKRIQAQLGDTVAEWAYADKGIGPGLRAPCATAHELAKWSPNAGDWCRVIIGIQGSGKSVAAARYVADRGGSMVSATAVDGWGFGGGSTLAQAVDRRWFLIDDLGESKTRPGDGNVATLISDRYARRSRAFLVITTALTFEEIQRRYGDNLASRLKPHVVELFLREQVDRRGAIPPVMSGFNREMEVAWYGQQVEYAAAGVLGGDAATDAINRLALAAGVDLDGSGMAAALASNAERLAEIDRMAAGFLSTMASAAAVRSESALAHDAELDAWIDSMTEAAP